VSQDRRRLRRHFKRVVARFQCGPVSGEGYLCNMSKDGMFLRAEPLPRPRTDVLITIESPHGDKVEVRGRVVWTTAEMPNAREIPPGFGVQVEEGSRSYREFYESLLLS
jgi:Tfp pilus assembly protein PilZ